MIYDNDNMKSVYRYPRAKVMNIIVLCTLALWVTGITVSTIYKEDNWTRIFSGIYFLVMAGYFAYLQIKGRVTVDPAEMALTVVPGKKRIFINDITKIEIILSPRKHRVKRVNIYSSPSRFYTINIEKPDEFASQLQRLNPSIQVSHAERSV